VIQVQLPGPVSGKLERFHRAVAKSTKPDAIRAAFESILSEIESDSRETLVQRKPTVQRGKRKAFSK
jgi:hypothetical protein